MNGAPAMKIAALYVQGEKDEQPRREERVSVEPDKGVAGDRHQDGELALLDADAPAAIAEMERRGLCMKRFHPAALVTGLAAFLAAPPGANAVPAVCAAGTARLEILPKRKRCFPECVLFQQNTDCPLRAGAAFARVLTSGVVSEGDSLRELKN